MIAVCPVCRSSERQLVFSLHGMPALINAQVRPERARDVPRGDIDLVVCTGCGHLYNESFDESVVDYDATYENSLHFSPAFRRFADELADRLVQQVGLIGATAAELGSGPGHFLSMLCERGLATGLGYDPSYSPDRLGAPDHPSVSISTDPFPVDGSLQVEFAFSQHVLEHLEDPVVALEAERKAVAPVGGSVYNEVPNGALMLQHCALWDLIYEHLSYFVPNSFELAHRRAGLEVTRIGTAFGDQFLWGDAQASERAPTSPGLDVVADVERAVAFGEEARARVDNARTELASWADRGPVALWGAGSKGATYLNVVDGVANVDCVVDINPRKHGWGVPGTSLVISGPEVVAEVRPATVLVANPIYVDEVDASVREQGVTNAVVRALWT